MFRNLMELFAPPTPERRLPVTTELAVAALLVHLAGIDGEFADVELDRIRNILREHFHLDDDAVNELIVHARKKDQEAVDFYQFTSLLTQLDMDQRVGIIRMMWNVVFADHVQNEMEDNMVWRVAELIGVPARERTMLRAEVRKEQSDPE
ncbi:MAG: TerB family tellurite resistance protein [Hyphomicrobiaceae bacterium]|nr:TerB family tellurite resistance protein [Hyphomicrobiaceae bacterium]